MQRLPGIALWRPRDEDAAGTRSVQFMQQRVQASRIVDGVRGRDGARDDRRSAIEQGARREPPWAEVLRDPCAKLHLYGKGEPRPGRKMGHLTVLAPNHAQALAAANRAALRLQLPAVA